MKKKNRCFSFVEYTSSNGQKKAFYSSFTNRKYFSSIHDVFIRTKELEVLLDIFDSNIDMKMDIRLLYFLYESMYDELLIEEDIFMFDTFEELKPISTTGEKNG